MSTVGGGWSPEEDSRCDSDRDRWSWEANFVPLLPSSKTCKSETFAELMGQSLHAFTKANHGQPPWGCAYDGGKPNAMVNKLLLGLVSTVEAQGLTFWKDTRAVKQSVVEFCVFGQLYFESKNPFNRNGCCDARHVLKRLVAHHMLGSALSSTESSTSMASRC